MQKLLDGLHEFQAHVFIVCGHSHCGAMQGDHRGDLAPGVVRRAI